MHETLRLALISIIISIAIFICVILFSTIFRRVLHNWKYRRLDRYRDFYREKLNDLIDSGKVSHQLNDFISLPSSTKFQAIEDTLLDLINDDRYKESVKGLLERLGYIPFYEKRLKSNNNITRASAIDKLGRMLSETSTNKLVDTFRTKNAETISVAVRSLSKIGSTKALKGILEHLPHLLKESLISQKTVEASLTNFGVSAIPTIIEYGRKNDDTMITASLLDVLSNLPFTKVSCSFAIDHLKNKDAEIRAKALKVLSQADISLIDFDQNLLVPLLEDTIWFVRLHAAKALGNMRYKKAADTLGGLLLDENWQVRDTAAMALTKFEDDSIDIFLKALKFKDRYAKESICEEIEKTDFISRLITNLISKDPKTYEKSKEILHIMYSLNFSTPLAEYLKKGGDDKIKKEIHLILNKETKT